MSINSRILLSICIPTFNRGTMLKQCLLSLISQDEFINGNVEIVVSDNNSTDDTEEIMHDFVSKNKNIIYNKNTKNIFDANFKKVLFLSNGIYKKLCKDSVIFNNDYLKLLCSIIRDNVEKKPTIIWLDDNKSITPIIKEIKYHQAINESNFQITDIITFGIWEKDKKYVNNTEYNFSDKLWQVYALLKILNNSKNIMIVNYRSYELQKYNKPTYNYNIFNVFHNNYFKLLYTYIRKDVLQKIKLDFLEIKWLDIYFMHVCLYIYAYKNFDKLFQNENLYKEIEQYYKQKKYWFKFKMMFAIKLRLYYIKIFIDKFKSSFNY